MLKLFNYNIDLKSFLRKSPVKIDDDFGVSLITGSQGSGKTYFGVYILYTLLNDNRKIYTNIHSLRLPNRTIVYFNTLDEITDNIEENCIFLVDELSKKFTKECKQDKKFYSWLQQSRKRKRYVLLLTQEYLQVPLWLRGVCRYIYTTHKGLFSLFITYKGFAELNDDKEWVVVPQSIYIYKRNKLITKLYDTLEPVNTL